IDGYSRPYVAGVCYGSAIYGFGALLLAAAVARRLAYPALGAAFCIWIGTPLIFYMYLAPVFAHACGAFAVTLLLWIWLWVRERWTPGGLAALGAAAALVAMVREQDVVLAAGPALDFLWSWSTTGSKLESLRRNSIAAAAGLASFATVYTPQMLAYRAI